MMKSTLFLKAVSKTAGLLAALLALGLVLAGCADNKEEEKDKPGDVTVTIRNTLTGAQAKNITGVRVTISDGTGTCPIGGSGGYYDTSYTVDTNGTAVTLPPFTVGLSPAGTNQGFNISVQLADTSSASFVFSKDPNDKLPSTLILDLDNGPHSGYSGGYYLKQVN